jgi:hypothetical protein
MCEHGMILKQGVAKTGKPYYGYVCKGSNKDHAKWAKMTNNAINFEKVMIVMIDCANV